MASRSSKHASKPSTASKKPKSDDWKEVTEPEERRRIQNRIAQRKFREKTKESKQRAERDAQNQAHAIGAYHVPQADELQDDGELSGLPWGGPSLAFVVARGHASSSQQGSRRASDQLAEEAAYLATPLMGGFPNPPSWDGRDSSGGEDARYYEGGFEGEVYEGSPYETPYYYDYENSGGSN